MSRRCRSCMTVNPPRVHSCGACLKPLPKNCEQCGDEFSKPSRYSWAQFEGKRYCSDGCAKAARSAAARLAEAAQQKVCVVCKSSFSRPRGRGLAQWEQRETCSKACGDELRATRVTQTLSRRPKQLPLPSVAKLGHRREDGKRKCPRCSEVKAAADFMRKHVYCKTCHNQYQYEHKLASFFGLTPAEDQALLDYQGGTCAICHRAQSGKRHATDHDHKTGLIRGKLCWVCNQLLGAVRDNPDLLRAAADYLEAPPAVRALGREVYGRKGRTTNKAPKRKKKSA